MNEFTESEAAEVKKERGWGLTIVIPVAVISAGFQALVLLYNLVTNDSRLANIPIGQTLFSVAQYALIITFLVAAWRWKRWGCFGYIGLIIVSAIISAVIGWSEPIYLTATAVSALFAFAVYKQKEAYFE